MNTELEEVLESMTRSIFRYGREFVGYRINMKEMYGIRPDSPMWVELHDWNSRAEVRSRTGDSQNVPSVRDFPIQNEPEVLYRVVVISNSREWPLDLGLSSAYKAQWICDRINRIIRGEES